MKKPELDAPQTRMLIAALVGVSTGFLIATALDGWMAQRAKKAAGCADCARRANAGRWVPAEQVIAAARDHAARTTVAPPSSEPPPADPEFRHDAPATGGRTWTPYTSGNGPSAA